MPRLSILICSIVTRKPLLERLLGILVPQIDGHCNSYQQASPSIHRLCGGEAEILIDTDDGEVSIGEKRNRLLAAATGDYVAFVDDDDIVSPDYVRLILAALSHNPDCVGFRMIRTVDGRAESTGIHTLRYEKYGSVKDKDGRDVYQRTPNHLNPVRRELALQIGYEAKNWGEDSGYAKRIYPLLQSECFVEAQLYTYDYRTPSKRKGEKVNK